MGRFMTLIRLICRWIPYLILVWASIAWSTAPEILTWDDCVQEAASHNPNILAGQHNIEKNGYLVKASRSDYYPLLTGSSGYNVSNSASTSAFNPAAPINVDTGARQQLDVQVQLDQNVFSGFRTVAGVQRTRADLANAQASLLSTKVQTSSDLKIAFARLLFAQEQTNVDEKIVERRTENVRFVTLRFEGGRENKGSVMRNQALLDQAKYDLAQTERARRVAQRDLARVLGRPYNDNFDSLGVKGSFGVQFPATPPTFSDLTPEHPDYQVANAQVQGAKADVRLAKSDLYPALAASASTEQRVLSGNSKNLWSAGINLNYPFALGGADIYEVKSARAEEYRLAENQTNTANQLTFQMKQAYNDFKDAVENIRVQEDFLKASEVRAEIGRAQYANGLISYQDWDLVENDLINNQRTILESRRDALIAEANWERAMGQGEIP